ncbi:hypothetical protein CNMCM8694_000016 [Aspergillus lentulus]|nr:hypothetical protein CNMCM8060_009621 [Aspergillus lentulus]KAF4192755.1 hypothetical protein CNMCM8694_000016 [Aspergillus lentulus]
MPSLKLSQRSLWGTVLSLFQSNSRKKQRSRSRRPRYGSTNKKERVKEREQSRERHKHTGRRRGNRGRGERRDYDGEEETWKEQKQEENTKIEEQKQEENTKTEEQNAREHIQRIRQDLGVDEQHNKLASGLERALNVLSEDVYQSPAHFFLELIQNADDNVYQAESSTPSTSKPKVIPTLAVAYRNGRLRTDCNELGFSKKNVDAICNAGLSTKRYESRSTGEKGVGFKSVFLVADIVWIASKAYTFKFDRGQRLGMLIPIWESLPPPEEIRQGYTSMVFQLSSDVDVPALLHGIRAYASRALIFLKQLRCINLNIEDQDEIPCASVTRKDENLDKRGVYMTTLTYSDNSERRYIVTEYKIDQMPSDKKRPNQTESEIKLAFPIDADGQPILQAQDVYSFLPVRSYGFTVCELNPQQIRLWLTIQQFLLQANFVLPTSREEISDKSDKSGKPDWNGKIRVEIPNAFVTAIEYLIQGRLRYSWIKFLPKLQPQKDFFEHVRPRIWASIAEKPFLASESDQLTKPSSLRYIPHEFRHSDDIPFTLGRNTEGRYLSRRYSEDDWSILKDLGVRQLSLEEFLEDLKLLIECDKGIENKSLEWHLGIAEALNGHKDLDKNMKLLQTLQIIPLREGWTSADKGLILLPPEKESTALPPGIKVFEIHQDIQDNKENIIRRALFQRAGAKPYSVSDIHGSIVSNQVNKKSAESGPLSHLIAQLDFLHRTGWSNQGNTDIWVATTDNKYCLASSVYIDSNLEDSAAAIFAKGGLTVPLLHRDYLTISTENKESWIFFLFWNLGIYRIPRLVANINMYTQELSPDFERVTEILPSPRWLQLLKDHRNIYETWLDKGRFSQTAKVREKLKSKLVECHDTPVKSALKDTFLVPRSLLIDNSIPIPRLKVENDHEHGWSILSHLEVLLDTNVQFYIRCLQRLRESENITPSEDQMYAMYRALQNRYSENQKDVVRHTFRISKLVYVPIGESKRKSAWLSADECVWEGPDSFLQTPRLEKVYKDCKHLFHEVLGVQDADPGRILKEIEICRPTILQDILELFQDADRLLKKNGEKKVKGIGLGSEIFPVYNFLGGSGPFRLADWYGHSPWWIADEWELRESAGTQVALLAFDYVDLLRMPSIMDAFELQSRMLSTWAKKSLKHEGRQQLSLETAHFHHRIRFIRRTPRLGIILHCLKNIKLFQADKLTSEWTVVSPLGQRIITSNTLTIQSFLKEEDDGLHVYVATNTIAKKRFPVDLMEGTDESESADGHSLNSGLRAESPISEPSDPPPNSLPSRLMRFVRSGSTKEKTTYQGGLAEGTILSLYRQVVDVKKESHEPILVGGPEREQHYKSQSQSQSRSRSSQSAPYIVDPGLPDRSLRDFTRNLVKRTTRKELAQVIYLDGVVDEISLDKNIITHTGRVAKFLEREFPDYYKPDVHWTSPSRSPVGYNRDDTKATFTLPDAAKFTEFLVQHGYEQAKDWNNRPVTYHLDVYTTAGDLHASFQLHQKRFDMARKISMKTTKNEVFVLIRVYNIYDQPDMAFYVNPWNLYAAGKLDLTAQGDHYLAALMDASSDTSSFNITDYEWRDGYKYQPLEPSKGIRLLKLFPGKKESPLEGILFPTSLDAGDEYIAVSYTWGPALKPYRIRTEEGDIPIPASLYSALRQVRRLDETVLVWADAISIHQTDKPEKVQQISLLPVIFQQAVQVFGWVGERADQSELAIKSLRTMNDPKKENAISGFGQEKWTAISKLFQRPWFMRSWIIQEVILARDLIVHCGSDHIRWEDLYEAVKSCQAHAEKSIKTLDIPTMRDMSTILSLGETRHGYRQLEKTYNLLDLFELFHHAKATFKRDRLFTLLNVAADAADSPKLKPDYKSSLEDIVCRYASEFVHRKKAATLLYRGRISSQPERFPSWIPDWTADPYPKTITSWHPEREFCAAGKMEENAHLAPKDDKDDRILLIDGCLVDEIEKLGKCTSEVDDALDYIADIFEFIDKHGSSYLTRESIEDLKWKLPIGNAKKAPWGDWLGQAFRASFQALAEYMELRKDDSQKQFTERYSRAEIMKQRLSQLHEELWLFLFTAIDFSERFRPSIVCLTKRGYFGLVPGTARKGDFIVLLYGGVVPFCLRRSEQKNIYQLVGEAYIHGIMHGEALDFEGVQVQTFDLY